MMTFRTLGPFHRRPEYLRPYRVLGGQERNTEEGEGRVSQGPDNLNLIEDYIIGVLLNDPRKHYRYGRLNWTHELISFYRYQVAPDLK